MRLSTDIWARGLEGGHEYLEILTYGNELMIIEDSLHAAPVISWETDSVTLHAQGRRHTDNKKKGRGQ